MYEEIGKAMREKMSKKEMKDTFLYDTDRESKRVKGLPQGAAPDFGKAIKTLLKQHNMTEAILSQKSGINEKSIRSIENHSTLNPSFDCLERIATAFEMPLLDFIQLAQASYRGNCYLTSPSERWVLSYELEKGFSIHVMTPPNMSKRDFFTGTMTILGEKKLNFWKFPGTVAKACIQAWDGSVIFTYHGMNWKEEYKIQANQTFYFDPCIPHSFENPSPAPTRQLLTTYPSLF